MHDFFLFWLLNVWLPPVEEEEEQLIVYIAAQILKSSSREQDASFFKNFFSLCAQFQVVIEAVRCKDPTEAARVDLGKECSDLGAKWVFAGGRSSTFKYYLHTLVHHAAELQGRLLRIGFCLGMFENQSFEARHKVGRVATAKSLHGDSRIDRSTPNPGIYAVTRIMSTWQHGLDLVDCNEFRQSQGMPHVETFTELRREPRAVPECSLVGGVREGPADDQSDQDAHGRAMRHFSIQI